MFSFYAREIWMEVETMVFLCRSEYDTLWTSIKAAAVYLVTSLVKVNNYCPIVPWVHDHGFILFLLDGVSSSQQEYEEKEAKRWIVFYLCEPI